MVRLITMLFVLILWCSLAWVSNVWQSNSCDAEIVHCYHSIGSNIKMKSLLYNSQEAFLDTTQQSHSKIVLGQLNICMFTCKCTEIQANIFTHREMSCQLHHKSELLLCCCCKSIYSDLHVFLSHAVTPGINGNYFIPWEVPGQGPQPGLREPGAPEGEERAGEREKREDEDVMTSVSPEGFWRWLWTQGCFI